MKFKPGDIARIRSDLQEHQRYGRACVVDSMLRFRGKAAKITEMVYDFGYRIEGSPSLWTNEMFESVAVGPHRKPALRENVDRCVCCGDETPEGRTVCWQCEHGYGA
jgi:hypothetical protein